MKSSDRLLPVDVSTASLYEVLNTVDGWMTNGERAYVCFANVHVIEASRSNVRLRDALHSADLVLPDGAPIAWIAGITNGRHVARIAGASFFDAVCEGDIGKRRHYLYGSTPATLSRLRQELEHRYPSICICGFEAPPFAPTTDDQTRAAYDRINAAAPDVVWVGLGAPKQELWMRAARPHLDAPVLAGIGAAFDFVAGVKPRAPQWMQDRGLEWFHRLATEPRRLMGRYVRTNLAFCGRVVWALGRARIRRGHG